MTANGSHRYGCTLPDTENAMSRRYLALLLGWIPVGMRSFHAWPVRPRSGHFFGGVFWYGLETSRPMVVLALAAASAEFAASRTGYRAEELRQVALQGLRYLCFTHDTGPSDGVRPQQSWGRPEPAGTKWGERGQGFFRESQCGQTMAHLALAAALLDDLLGHEERDMLAAMATDYLERFGHMAPRSGVYYDTQTEENAWTALGLVASLCLLPASHPLADTCWQQSQRWMFCTATMPQDAWNDAVFADGKTVRELCNQTYTWLPDGTAENHGFVHPSYMATAITLAAETANLLTLYGHPIPPHLWWHRHECYRMLHHWCDVTGVPHSVQGMDWPYLAYPAYCFLHTAANLYLADATAANLEQRALETVERAAQAHAGQMVPTEIVQHCHTFQDPALMLEGSVVALAHAYLAHRLHGVGQPISQTAPRHRSEVKIYPHGGCLVHRHAHGQTSLSWRNRTMVLPATTHGVQLIGPCAGAMLASIQVVGRAASTELETVTIREAADRVAVLLVENIAQDSVRREVLFASLPHGKCLVAERLVARTTVTVQEVIQGRLSIINDGYFGVRPDLRGQRRIVWDGGECVCYGYVSGRAEDDQWLSLSPSRWVNIDNQCGLVFQGSGEAVYHNRHTFPVWRAVEDALLLNVQRQLQEYTAGAEIARCITLWCPEQTWQDTARQHLFVRDTAEGVVAIQVDGYLCAGNFRASAVDVPLPLAPREVCLRVLDCGSG